MSDFCHIKLPSILIFFAASLIFLRGKSVTSRDSFPAYPFPSNVSTEANTITSPQKQTLSLIWSLFLQPIFKYFFIYICLWYYFVLFKKSVWYHAKSCHLFFFIPCYITKIFSWCITYVWFISHIAVVFTYGMFSLFSIDMHLNL